MPLTRTLQLALLAASASAVNLDTNLETSLETNLVTFLETNLETDQEWVNYTFDLNSILNKLVNGIQKLEEGQAELVQQVTILAGLVPRVGAAEDRIADLQARRVTEDVFRLNDQRIDLPAIGDGDEYTVHSWTVPAGETLDVAATFDIDNSSIEGRGARAQLWSEVDGTRTVVAESSTVSSTVMGRTAELTMLYRGPVDRSTTFTLTLGSFAQGQVIAEGGSRFGYRTYGQEHGQPLPEEHPVFCQGLGCLGDEFNIEEPVPTPETTD